MTRVQKIDAMELSQMEAAINALPTNPEHMWISVWRADYSSIADQLRTLPHLDGADFGFAEGNKDLSGGVKSNIAYVEQPTSEMLLGIYKNSEEIHGRREVQRLGLNKGNSTKDERNAFYEIMKQLRVDFHRAEWNYNADDIMYDFHPEDGVWKPRNSHSLPQQYPREVGFDDVVLSDFERQVVDQGSHVIIQASQIKIDHMTPSKVTASPFEVIVSYGKAEPDYLPTLTDALGGTGRLTLDRKV